MRLPDRLDGQQVAIRAFRLSDVEELVALRVANRAFNTPFEPRRSDGFFTPAGQRAEIVRDRDEWAADRMYAFAIVDRSSERIHGRVSLANIVRGAWDNATMGYFVDEAVNGHGFATEAVGLALRFAFGPARLHRVQAAVMPHNLRSARVLAKNGLRKEGFAPRYLRLAGGWRDHDLFAITAEEHRAAVVGLRDDAEGVPEAPGRPTS
jgi:[ribosomal protein S5]-alanine N-acetyltransferase